MLGFGKTLYKYKASFQIPWNRLAIIRCSSTWFLISALFSLTVSPSIHYELRDSQLENSYLSAGCKPRELLRPSQRFMPQVTFRSSLLLCYLPWWSFTSPSLLPGAVGTPCFPWQGPALPLLEEMANKVMGNRGCDMASAGQKQSDSFPTSAIKAALVSLLLHCFIATRLKLRNGSYGLILLHDQDYGVPYSIRNFSLLVPRGLKFQHPWTWFGRHQAPLVLPSH